MERYIDADEAMHELAKVFKPDDFPKIVRAISSTSTADVRSAVHAHWVYKPLEGCPEITFPVCSNCDEDAIDYVESNFCPNCGAVMNEWSEECGKPQGKAPEESSEEEMPYTMLFRATAKDYRRLEDFLGFTNINYALYAEQDMVHHPVEKSEEE